MKVAIVHELLTMPGGAERVAKIFSDMFPEAPIYTLLYNERKMGKWFPKERVRASSVLHPLSSVLGYNHHLHLPLFPRAVEAWDFSEFDLILSNSSAFVHGLKTEGSTKHLCYVNSPARYLWDRYLDVKSKMNPLLRPTYSWLAHRLRQWDASVADRPDKLIAASRIVQRRCQLYWRRESEVINPPIEDLWFESPTPNTQRPTDSPELVEGPYFLIVSTLARYKNLDLAIQACNQLKLPLKIIGDGPDRKRLESLAGPTVEFLGFASEDTIKSYYQGAEAVIFPGDEDFGLVPLEAMAGGTPVIAYRSGGALETIKESTGVFFNEPTTESLTEVLKAFSKRSWDRTAISAHAQAWRRQEFEAKIRGAISSL